MALRPIGRSAPARRRPRAPRPSGPLKARIKAGEVILGCGVSIGHPTLAELAGHAGFDLVQMDFEHGSLDVAQAEAMTVAARAVGVPPIWRVNHLEHGEIQRALDLGAEGVLVPHVKSAQEARQVVAAALYPPAGNRGAGARRPVRFGVDDSERYLRAANRSTVVMLMIEDREAIESIDEIASVPGIDVFNVGTWDLSRSLGVPIKTRHPKVLRAIEKVRKAAQAGGIAWGVPPESPRDAARWHERGARFFECASIDELVLSAGSAKVEAIKERLKSGGRHKKGRK